MYRTLHAQCATASPSEDQEPNRRAGRHLCARGQDGLRDQLSFLDFLPQVLVSYSLVAREAMKYKEGCLCAFETSDFDQ
jgi:hypothetical protein